MNSHDNFAIATQKSGNITDHVQPSTITGLVDWTGGLTLKSFLLFFYADSLAYGVMWTSCRLFGSYILVLEQIIHSALPSM